MSKPQRGGNRSLSQDYGIIMGFGATRRRV